MPCCRMSAPRQPKKPEPGDELSPKELRVAELAAQRLSTKEIAARIHRSEHTVNSHLDKVLVKLACKREDIGAKYAHLMELRAGRGLPNYTGQWQMTIAWMPPLEPWGFAFCSVRLRQRFEGSPCYLIEPDPATRGVLHLDKSGPVVKPVGGYAHKRFLKALDFIYKCAILGTASRRFGRYNFDLQLSNAAEGVVGRTLLRVDRKCPRIIGDLRSLIIRGRDRIPHQAGFGIRLIEQSYVDNIVEWVGQDTLSREADEELGEARTQLSQYIPLIKQRLAHLAAMLGPSKELFDYPEWREVWDVVKQRQAE